MFTSGKTLRMPNDPWAHRGKPFEIEAMGDDTCAERVAFRDHGLRRDPATLCDALLNAATAPSGNRAKREGRTVALGDVLA